MLLPRSMPKAGQGAGDVRVLSSPWPVNSHLLARIFPVKRTKGEDGKTSWVRDTQEQVEVHGPLENAQLEMTLSWTSPFEQAGAESKAPTMAAMLQSGSLQPVLDAIGGAFDNKSALGKAVGEKLASASDALKGFEGRTGITKLNSTQIFAGMPPMKITATMLFRAWSDAEAEVTKPVDQLVKWALPIELARDSTALIEAINAGQGRKSLTEAVMPSRSPVFVAVIYKGRTYCPMVIESAGLSLDDPIHQSGHQLTQTVQLNICSLTALDRADWTATRTTTL